MFHSRRLAATLVGFSAIFMWATLASLSGLASEVPPLQLVAMTLAVGACVGLVTWPFRPGAVKALRAPLEVWALGVYGLFGYHFFYFTALRLAPPVEANLINYMWPLLIVLFSALLPGERLKPHHLIGSLAGFAGVAILVTGGAGLSIAAEYVPGYAAAVVCAVVWSSYSVLSRRFGAQPTDTVVGFCLASAVLAAVCHLAFETTVWPSNLTGWLAVIAIGVLPTGAAFYAWDVGMKRGDIQVLGALSYATPVMSTILLVMLGLGQFSVPVVVALVLVTAGALFASKDMLRGRPDQSRTQ